jgi:hypothetical protein
LDYERESKKIDKYTVEVNATVKVRRAKKYSYRLLKKAFKALKFAKVNK